MTIRFLVTFVLFATACNAQPISWTEQPMASLPVGVKLFRGERANPALRAWYLQVNMSDTSIAIRPYITTSPEGVVPFTRRVNAYAAAPRRHRRSSIRTK